MTELSTIAPRRLPDAAPPVPAHRTPGQGNTAPGGAFADVFAALNAGPRVGRDAARTDADRNRPEQGGTGGNARSQDAGAATPALSEGTAATSDTELSEHDRDGAAPNDDNGPPRPDGAPVVAMAAPVVVQTQDAAPGDAPDGAIAVPVTVDARHQTNPSGDEGAELSAHPAIPNRAAARNLPTEGTPPHIGTPVGAPVTQPPGSAPTPETPATPDSPPGTVLATAAPLVQGGQLAQVKDPGSAIAADTAAPADTSAAGTDAEAMTAPPATVITPRDAAMGNGGAAGLRPAETATFAAMPDVAVDTVVDTAIAAPGQTTPAQNAAPIAGTVGAAQPPALSPAGVDATGRPMPAPFLVQTEAADWMSRLVERIGSGATAGIDEIEITLAPRNLGSLTVRIDLRETAASVAIVTETPEAARLFNDQQGKLAELLSQSGLSLGDHRAGTSGGPGSQGHGTGRTPAHGTTAAAGGPGDSMDIPAPAPRRAGLVDLLA